MHCAIHIGPLDPFDQVHINETLALIDFCAIGVDPCTIWLSVVIVVVAVAVVVVGGDPCQGNRRLSGVTLAGHAPFHHFLL